MSRRFSRPSPSSDSRSLYWARRSTIADQLRRHHRFLGLAPTVRAAAGQKRGHKKAMAALQEAQSLEAHTALMQAALDRDREKAKRLMIAHIGYTMHVYVHTEEQGAGEGFAKGPGNARRLASQPRTAD